MIQRRGTPAGRPRCSREPPATHVGRNRSVRPVPSVLTRRPDARALALALFLRRWAGAFSFSADALDSPDTALAGMALLDAAQRAEQLAPDDPVIIVLSEAGHFEPMPGGHARFVETVEIRHAVLRLIVGRTFDGGQILAVIASASGPP